MTIAIVGSSGYIAGYLLERLEKMKTADRIVKINRSGAADAYLDLEKAQEFDYQVLDEVDVVIFTAAVSGPDQCAQEFEHCFKINVTGTKYFIHEALKRNCRVLFFSSDAVFGDIPGYIYDEESETKANTPYGIMKKAIEDEFKENAGFKAIRLAYVVSAKDRFVKYCLNCIKNGEKADIFHPFYRNCIVVSDVVDIVIWMIGNWEKYEPFALNAAGGELVSRIRIADEINRNFHDKLRYGISVPDQGFFKNRPKITQMKSLYLKKYDILEDQSFTEKIRKELEEIQL